MKKEIIGATRFFKGGGSSPEPRDLYRETYDELKAKLDLAPAILGAEAQYRPQYQNLEMEQLQDLLFGHEAGTGEESYMDVERVPAVYDESQPLGYFPNGMPITNPKTGRGLMTPRRMVSPEYTRQVMRTRQVNRSAQRGLLDLLEKDILPASDRMTSGQLSRQREAEIGDVETLGPRATAAWRSANPEQAALLSELNRQAQEELNAGASLDPSLRREVQQSVRQGQSARGMGMGMNDLADEGFMDALAAEQLRRNRQQFATGIAGLNQQTSIDPFMATLGRPALGVAQGNNLVNQGFRTGAMAGPQLFGSTINANDVFDSNFNADAAARISGANNDAAMNGALIGGGGALAGGIILAL